MTPVNADSRTFYRKMIRLAVVFIVLSQLVVVTAFFCGIIREPYPVILLPSFDQVVAENDHTYAFILPRFYIRFESGNRQEIKAAALFRGIGKVRDLRAAYWIISRLAPPPGVTPWRPTLPAYGFVFEKSELSPAFLSWLAQHLGKLQFAEKQTELQIVWERRRFGIHNGVLAELESTHLGSVNVPIGRANANSF